MKKTKGKIIENNNTQEIVIYRGPKGPVSLLAQIKQETILATLNQIADLFGVQKAAISKHIKNILSSGELSKKATVSILETVQNEGGRKILRSIEYYNLDMIIAVGYRVNSKQATAFRIWATETLRDYLLHGYVLNKQVLLESKRNTLKDLEKTVELIQSVVQRKYLDQDEVSGVLQVIREYANSFVLLDTYDKGELVNLSTKSNFKNFPFKEARLALDELKKELINKGQATELFAKDRKENLEGIVSAIHQSFGGKNLYDSVELRAAHLLYFIIKDHPFFDGNKRSGAFLFVRFLDIHNKLRRKNGEKIIADNTLTALALLVAESDPKEKEQIIALITQLIK